MKIGIPRALVYYYYYPFWKAFFNKLGHQVILSKPTKTSILNRGVKEATAELCVPIKVYIGQVLDLNDNGVDKIYIPRFISIRKGVTFCPKFLGLPDLIKHSLQGLDGKILTHYIESKSDDISGFNNYRDLIDKLKLKSTELKNALSYARKEWYSFRKLQQKGYSTEELLEGNKIKQNNGNLNIGLLGYVYNMYDQYINMDLLTKLKALGVRVVTFDMLSNGVIERELKSFNKLMFWEFTNKLLGAGYHFIHSPQIDGLIHVSAFGCGPDSVLGPFLEIEAEKYNKPFMTLRIDEQTGESHLLTRLEAFVDLLGLNFKHRIS